MNTRFLEGTRNFLSDTGEYVQVEYFLLENELQSIPSQKEKIYGVEIIKKHGNYEKYLFTESDQVKDLTNNKEAAEYIINTLIANKVTPISMMHIMDDLLLTMPCI